MENFFQRINYRGKLEDIGVVVAEHYDLGALVSSRLVPTGYEDFNFVLETTKGKHFVKVFANFRTDKGCLRYVEIMVKAGEERVSTPKLLWVNGEYFYSVSVHDIPLRLCVMEYIDGHTYYDLGVKPNAQEVRSLVQQAARINSMNLKPEFEYDSWAVVNFLNEFHGKGEYLSPEDRKRIEPLVGEFKKIDFERLPYAFVHGDLIATNVMKDKDDRDWVIDFAVANFYPRIQELAVLASNMLLDEKSKGGSEANLELALEEYQTIVPLTRVELDTLSSYIKLAHGMHILLAGYKKMVEGNNSEENKYWLNQGRVGFSQLERK